MRKRGEKKIDVGGDGGKGRVYSGRIAKRGHGGGSNKENKNNARTPKQSKLNKSINISSPFIPRSPNLNEKDFTTLIKIGFGGFSEVFKAKMVSTGTPCVLKILKLSALKALETNITEIRQEASLHWKLKHPNISALLGYYETSVTSTLVMEYCEKGDLHDYIHNANKTHTRSPSRNQDYIRQLVTGLEYFQRTSKHIHMDVKPENILLTSRNIIKLSDFGCCVYTPSSRHVHFNHKGGTKIYRPPEMVRPNRQFDSTVDVWSIGCVAFQLNATDGEHPFYNFCPSKSGFSASEDIQRGLVNMEKFRTGSYNVGNYSKMDPLVQTFLRQTIGTEREQRPLISKLLDTAFLTSTARTFIEI